ESGLSLISEALKRARLEAARREGEERRTVYASAPAYAPRRRRPPAAALVAAGLAVGVLAGAGIYWALRAGGVAPGPPPAAPARPAAPAAPVAKSPAPQPAAQTAPQPAPIPAPVAAAAAPQPSTPQSPPIAVAPPRASAPPAPPAAPPAARAAPPAPAQPPPPAAPEPGRTYSRAVDLAGGKRLELDGIVASPTEPLAMMNRRLMAPGEVIEGHTLVRIEPKRVELRGPGGATFFISLR
ncbi:MAG TPA: hypothetical protein VFE44_02380, partial [Thermoanaerobaculia bacterium]|nr:hypothetical protein [Thermoanaerobaculia bacterium]